MSCPYYKFESGGWFGGDYYCNVVKKAVNSDTYYKFCRNYDYSNCPNYKSTSSGGCYLTSACTAARGLPDDCQELTTLRRFRDTWLKHQPDGITLIAHYYEVAPKIVEAIDKLENRLEIYDKMYLELVIPCVDLISTEQYDEALALYRDTTLELENRYLR